MQMPFIKSLPDDAHAAHIFAKYPHIYKLYSMASLGIMRGPSPLSFAQRELLGAYVSALNGCSYCAGSHTNTARMFGVDPGLLQQLLDDIEAAAIDSKLKPLFTFIGKLVKTPYKMVQKDAEAVFAAGWDEDALHSAVAVCCTFEFMNHLILGMGINASRDDYEALGRERFKTRWTPMVPQHLPESSVGVAHAMRITPPVWEFESAPETMAATDAMYDRESDE
jgi:uncharacterized peroxidase-related enzyme